MRLNENKFMLYESDEDIPDISVIEFDDEGYAQEILESDLKQMIDLIDEVIDGFKYPMDDIVREKSLSDEAIGILEDIITTQNMFIGQIKGILQSVSTTATEAEKAQQDGFDEAQSKLEKIQEAMRERRKAQRKAMRHESIIRNAKGQKRLVESRNSYHGMKPHYNRDGDRI